MVTCSYAARYPAGSRDTTARYPNQVVILDNLNLDFYKTEEDSL
jgi:hypothetical protein